MRDQTVLITGANSGIGAATAMALAASGAEIIMLCRNLFAAHRVADHIRGSHSEARISVYLCDFQYLASVRSAAEQVLDQHPRLTMLINNAGIYLPRRRTTEDHMEATIQTNHLGPFLLTNLLIPRLIQNAPARIVTISSEAHRAGQLRWEDLQSKDEYRGFEVYGTSKLMNILHTRSLAQRLQSSVITVNAVHPGMVASGFAQDEPSFLGTCLRWLAPFFRTPTQGAQTPIYLCTNPTGAKLSGEYFIDAQPRTPSAMALNNEHAERLWEVSILLTGSPSWEA
ncbi:MAG: SDR family oxidoreductase [Myxococcales bacterium]|nr:SDR family oxidoreductase [Myxococcales bacterium]